MSSERKTATTFQTLRRNWVGDPPESGTLDAEDVEVAGVGLRVSLATMSIPGGGGSPRPTAHPLTSDKSALLPGLL